MSINILHIINGWPAGGITEQVYLQCKHLPKEEFKQYSIGFCHFDGTFVKKFEDVGVECIKSNESYDNLEDVIRDKQIHVVVKQTGGGDYPPYVKLLKFLNIPLVEFLHCPRASIIPIEELAAIFYTTPYTLQQNDERHRALMHSVQYALDLVEPIIKADEVKARHNTPFYVGRLGRIVQDKRPDVILKIAMACWPLYKDAILFKIAGMVPQDTEYHREYGEYFLEQCASLPNIEYVGYVEDKYDFWKRLDICINPVWETSFDIVFLEAMACGVPIVTWADSAAPYVVSGAGLVTPTNVADLFMGLKYLIDHPEKREQMGRVGIENIKTKYSLKQYIDFHINQYRKIANG